MNKKSLSIITVSHLLFIATGCVITWAVWFMNMNGLGHGSNPIFAIPIAVMVLMLYIVLINILVEEMSDKQKLFIASLCIVLSSLAAYGMTK